MGSHISPQSYLPGGQTNTLTLLQNDKSVALRVEIDSREKPQSGWVGLQLLKWFGARDATAYLPENCKINIRVPALSPYSIIHFLCVFPGGWPAGAGLIAPVKTQ